MIGAAEVYIGQTKLGSIVPKANAFLAKDASGRALGAHRTQRDAMRAIVDADRPKPPTRH